MYNILSHSFSAITRIILCYISLHHIILMVIILTTPGDFFANLSLARRGLSEMAIAGCYGAPVFNILFGLGVSFIYMCSKVCYNV